MIEAAKQKKFQIILCKSQSRFTRDMELVEKYIHGLFPIWGIRFIAVADNADTEVKGNKKARQINGLVNEWYLEDLSENVRMVFDLKRKEGKYIGGFPIYGYRKDPADKNHIIPDPEAAEVVRQIYQWSLEGHGRQNIAYLLNQQGIPNPTRYKAEQGWSCNHPIKNDFGLWNKVTVGRILANEMYTGVMIQGRRRKVSYKSKVVIDAPESEWYRVEGTHEPIIDQGTFDQVQAQRNADREQYKANLGKYDYLGNEGNLFQGLIFCGDCGHPMVRYKSVTCKGRKVAYRYICPTYANLLEKSGCTYKYLPEEDLKAVLSRLIAQEAALAVDAGALIQKRRSTRTPVVDLELARAISERDNLDILRERLMRDLLSDILSKEDHNRMKRKYAQEAKVLEDKIAQLRKEQHREKHLLSDRNPWLAEFRKHTGRVELTDKLVRALVERITVYDNDRIEIQFKYRDERAALLNELQEREASAS